jgi:hypothetical protein
LKDGSKRQEGLLAAAKLPSTSHELRHLYHSAGKQKLQILFHEIIGRQKRDRGKAEGISGTGYETPKSELRRIWEFRSLEAVKQSILR